MDFHNKACGLRDQQCEMSLYLYMGTQQDAVLLWKNLPEYRSKNVNLLEKYALKLCAILVR